jgi:hypothetical protein
MSAPSTTATQLTGKAPVAAATQPVSVAPAGTPTQTDAGVSLVSQVPETLGMPPQQTSYIKIPAEVVTGG